MDEARKLARKIAADCLLRNEKWKPGVKAGIYEEIMRGDADGEAIVTGALAAFSAERAAIVAWLIAMSSYRVGLADAATPGDNVDRFNRAMAQAYHNAADAIERLDHHKGDGDA